jgi:hypothetical protein
MYSPTVDLSSSWGVEFEVGFTSREVPCECYKVAVLKDGAPWPGLPAIVTEGLIGTAPSGERMYFVDLTGNEKLTVGDFFTLENLESGAQYEVVLLWASNDNKITSEVINVP